MDRSRRLRLQRAVLVAAGVVGGLLLAAVVAVNVVIYSGTPDGYETTPAELIRDEPVVASVVIAIWVVLPLLGGWLMWRATRDDGQWLGPGRGSAGT